MVITADGPAQILSPSFQVSLEKPLGQSKLKNFRAVPVYFGA
jgi:hypothetical protein